MERFVKENVGELQYVVVELKDDQGAQVCTNPGERTRGRWCNWKEAADSHVQPCRGDANFL